jgi:SAM-dependent methyltransferase
MNQYTRDFFHTNQKYSLISAQCIVPLVLEIIPAQRVIDIGCGDGTWLKVFQENGVEEILGIDGDYVEDSSLVIPKTKFLPFDLTQSLTLDEKFDLVVSLEVAEHLPPDCAEVFIDSLTNLGSVVLFSAAIPYQRGENHINTQWQDYWIKLFEKRGFVVVDCIRHKIWNNENVAVWFRQNILMFVKQNYLENNPLLKQKLQINNNPYSTLPIVHPQFYLRTLKIMKTEVDPEMVSLKEVLRKLPIVMKRAIHRKFNSFR